MLVAIPVARSISSQCDGLRVNPLELNVPVVNFLVTGRQQVRDLLRGSRRVGRSTSTQSLTTACCWWSPAELVVIILLNFNFRACRFVLVGQK